MKILNWIKTNWKTALTIIAIAVATADIVLHIPNLLPAPTTDNSAQLIAKVERMEKREIEQSKRFALQLDTLAQDRRIILASLSEERRALRRLEAATNHAQAHLDSLQTAFNIEAEKENEDTTLNWLLR